LPSLRSALISTERAATNHTSEHRAKQAEELIETVMFEMEATRREAILWIERNDAEMGYETNHTAGE
jgi:hypothetical protein